MGAFIITLSLLSYGVGFISIERFKSVPLFALLFLYLGLILNIGSTVMMLIGSSHPTYTLHAVIGYIAMLIIFVYIVLVTRFYIKYGSDHPVCEQRILITKIVYGFWVIVYITGSLLVLW